MKLNEIKQEHFHQNNLAIVSYFGLRLRIDSENIEYLAIDSDGRIYGYIDEPYCGNHAWFSDSTIFEIGCVSDIDDWKDSLRYINGLDIEFT